MRLFIAINFDPETKKKLLEVQAKLRRLGKGNFSREENLHLTLAFIGEVPEERLKDVKAAMEQVKFPPMELCFHDVGYFMTGRDRPAQLWKVSLKFNRRLEAVNKELIQALREAGFSPDAKSFKPHVTLARELHVDKWDKKELLPEPFSTRADHMSLMLSERVDGKLTYTELYCTGGPAE